MKIQLVRHNNNNSVYLFIDGYVYKTAKSYIGDNNKGYSLLKATSEYLRELATNILCNDKPYREAIIPTDVKREYIRTTGLSLHLNNSQRQKVAEALQAKEGKQLKQTSLNVVFDVPQKPVILLSDMKLGDVFMVAGGGNNLYQRCISDGSVTKQHLAGTILCYNLNSHSVIALRDFTQVTHLFKEVKIEAK